MAKQRERIEKRGNKRFQSIYKYGFPLTVKLIRGRMFKFLSLGNCGRYIQIIDVLNSPHLLALAMILKWHLRFSICQHIYLIT